MTIFQNENVKVVRNEKDICFYDLKDVYNGTSGYTKKVRGLNKATEAITNLSADTKLAPAVTFWGIVHILDSYNLNAHTYCSID
jgi:hypothetical protein